MNEPSTPTPVAWHVAELLRSMAARPTPLLDEAATLIFETLDAGGTSVALDSLGEPSKVAAELLASGVAGPPGAYLPLIVDGQRLYAQRYHAYEVAVAAALRKLLDQPQAPPRELDDAITGAFASGVSFVTGGPGTGKTTLVAKVLAGLAPVEGPPLPVALMAPTGKAAARLSEAVSAGLPPEVLPRLRLVAGTVHRLLGALPPSGRFRHGLGNPLAYGVIVLDEASMIDLPLMAKLLAAVEPARTRLLVVGDPDQLPAVQAGAVLGDIAQAGRAAPAGHPLRKALVRLTRNWRSGENPQLAAFLLAVQENDPAVALDLARRGGSVRLHPVPGREALEAFLEERVLPAFRPLLAIDDPTEALRRLNEFRLVCALRQGPWGADALNAAAVARLRACASRPAHGSYFHGMPLIVTRNDPLTGLSNGDSGVVFFEGRRQVAWFGGAEAARPVPVQRLPAHQAACALTVHRSQGSEYRRVAILFPPQDHPLLTREMVYTAASRARDGVEFHSPAEVLGAAIARRAQRSGGLADRLL